MRLDSMRLAPWAGRSILLTVLSGLLALMGCGEHSEADVQTLMGSAKQYLQANDNKSAIIQLKNALQQNPELPEARFLLGQALFEDGHAGTALVELRRALDLHHPQERVVPILAQALLATGETRKLIEGYALTELADPLAQADLQTSLAVAFVQIGDRGHAKRALDDALKLAPDAVRVRMMQAHMLVANDKPAEARQVVADLLQKAPGDGSVWLLQGQLLSASNGNESSAMDAFKKAVVLKPDLADAHAGLLSALMAQPGQSDAVAAAFAVMKKALPNHPKTSYFEAALALEHGDFSLARQTATKLRSADPMNLDYLRLAGMAALRAGDFATADETFSKALEMAPGSRQLRHALAITYLRSGRPAQAVSMLQPLLDRGVADAQMLALGALARVQMGDIQKARTLYDAAARLKPSDAPTRAALAFSRLGEADADRSLNELQALSKDEQNTALDLALITGLMVRKEFDRALQAIDALQRKQPKNPMAPMLKGRIAIMHGDATAARRQFELATTIDPGFFPAYAALATLDIREGKASVAQQRFNALLERDPRSVHALLALASLSEQSTSPKEDALRLFASAVVADPRSAQVRVRLVNYHLHRKEFTRALAAAQDGASALPGNALILDALGRAQIAAQEYKSALNTFSQLASLQPESPLVPMKLAWVHLALKDTAQAVQYLNRALALRPGYPPAVQELVALHLAAGRENSALALADSLKKQASSLVTGLAAEGQVRVHLKQWNAAAAAYRSALKLAGGSTDLAIRLSAILQSAGKGEEAERFSIQWQKDHPTDTNYLMFLGERAAARQDYPGAEHYLRAVIKINPAHAPALNNLAQVLLNLKKPGALAYAEKANSIALDRPEFMDTLAMVLAQEKRLDEALALQKKAVALAPENPMLRLTLARLYSGNGNKELALQELKRLEALGESFPARAHVVALRQSM